MSTLNSSVRNFRFSGADAGYRDENDRDLTEVDPEQKVRLISNYFQIDLAKVKKIYCYTLTFTYKSGRDVYETLKSKLLECDVGKLLRELFKKILEIDNSDDGKVLMKQGCFEAFAYDNHRSVYSTCLVDNIELSIKKALVGTALWEKLDTVYDEIDMSMSYHAILDIPSNKFSSDSIQFLHILTWQSVFDGNSLFVLQNPNFVPEDSSNMIVEHDFYTKEAYDRKDVDGLESCEPRIGKTGLFKNIVTVNNKYLYLKLFPKRSLFFRNLTLSTYLQRKMKFENVHELAEALSGLQAREYLTYRLAGLQVKDTISNEIVRVKEFYKRADKTKVQIDTVKLSVDEYYRNNFGKFSNSRLPCVICEGGMNSSGIKYYLMEHLLIVENQSWDNFDDMSEEETQSVKNFRTQSYSIFTESLKTYNVISDLKNYLNAFGVDIYARSEEQISRILVPPIISYQNESVKFDVNLMNPWKCENKIALLKCPKKPKLMVFDFDGFSSDKKWDTFQTNLFAFGNSINLCRPQRHKMNIKKDQSKSAQIEKLINEFAEYDVLIFVIKIEKIKEFKKLIKFHEIGTKSVTIIVSSSEANNNQYKPVINQIIHKLNARIGGLNFDLRPPKRLLHPIQTSIVEEWSKRQFIGFHHRQLDLFHGAGSIAYTINKGCIIKGSYFIEKLGVETSVLFDSALLDAVCEYREINGHASTQIIFYMQVTENADIKQTIQCLKNSFQDVSIKYRSKYENENLPPFVIVTVQTDSCDALFGVTSTQESTPDLKVGTCLDKKIVNDNTFMLVQNHPQNASAIVLPSKFTIFDNTTKNLEDIEYTTYYMCAIHPVECKMIELPLPLRAASDFTKRACDNLSTLKEISSEDDDSPSAKKSRIDSMEDPFEDGLDDVIALDRLNKLLKPSSNYYFCA